MELRQLKYFAKVAELQSFSEASRELNITQSTLSQQIKKLEDEMNVTLLLRDSHHVQLTDVGEAIMPSVMKTIHDANVCRDVIQDVQNLNTGVLNIGATQSFTRLLKETILSFTKHYPGVRMNIICRPMEELMTMLDKEEIDLALSYRPSTPLYDTIESHILFDNNLCAVVSDTHPLAQRSEIRLQDLELYSLALPGKGTQARNTFDLLTKDLNLRMKIGIEVSEINMLQDIVRGSQFLTFLSRATVAFQDGLVAIPIEHTGCSMEGSYHLRKGTYTKKVTRQFLKMLCENNSYEMALMTSL